MTALNVDRIEEVALNLPQEDCQVAHHFGPGVYIREVQMKAGMFVIGHHHKTEHLNVCLRGSFAFIDGDKLSAVVAPSLFVAPPGRKMGFVMADLVWLNVFATKETSVSKLEEMLFDKSPAFEKQQEMRQEVMKRMRDHDRDDYRAVLRSLDMTEKEAWEISSNEDDLTDMPAGSGAGIAIRGSAIHGNGVFAETCFGAGELVGPARLSGRRTSIGRYANHSIAPNAVFVKNGNGDIFMLAKRNIIGRKGGYDGEEITVDYRQPLGLAGVGSCQQLQ